MLENIFGEKPLVEVKRKPKSVKISAQQLALHRERRPISEGYKEKIIEDQEISRYGREARLKKARKADFRMVFSEKNVKPKGKYYHEPVQVINPLEKVFKMDENQPEAYAEARILHFGGDLD